MTIPIVSSCISGKQILRGSQCAEILEEALEINCENKGDIIRIGQRTKSTSELSCIDSKCLDLYTCHSQSGLLSQKYYKMGGLKTKDLFLTVLKAGKSRIKVSTNLGSGERTHVLVERQLSSCCILT